MVRSGFKLRFKKVNFNKLLDVGGGSHPINRLFFLFYEISKKNFFFEKDEFKRDEKTGKN